MAGVKARPSLKNWKCVTDDADSSGEQKNAIVSPHTGFVVVENILGVVGFVLGLAFVDGCNGGSVDVLETDDDIVGNIDGDGDGVEEYT